jgi:hypothetical protein
MRESSEDDLGVRDVAGFVMMEEGVRREDVQGMELKKVDEEEREGGVMNLSNRLCGVGGMGVGAGVRFCGYVKLLGSEVQGLVGV